MGPGTIGMTRQSAILPLRLLVAALGLGLALAAGGTENAPRRILFDVPAGPLDAALREFAIQSGQQVIYPTDLVQGRNAAAVHGLCSIREALDRLLAPTGLGAWQDERTGALAVREVAAAVAPPPVRAEPARPPAKPMVARTAPAGPPEPGSAPVALPPFVVEEHKPVDWKYAELEDSEVLSTCSDRLTSFLVEQHYALHQMLETILPRSLQFRSDVPPIYLFIDRDSRMTLPPEVVGMMQRTEAANALRTPVGDQTRAITALPNYRLWDQDSHAIFFLTSESDLFQGQLRLTPGYVRHLLESRQPGLPRWFIEGFMAMYLDTVIHTAPLMGAGRRDGMPFTAYVLKIAPALWISPALTQEIQRRPNARIELLSLAALFRGDAERETGPRPADAGAGVVGLPDYVATEAKSPDIAANYDRLLRQSQSAIFLRWLFSGSRETRRAALWKFVDGASRGRATEAWFKECFGLDYAAVETELQNYVRTACRDSITLHPERVPILGPVDLRLASDSEVSRIKGDFNRLEIAYVRENYPALTNRYIEQARRTLRRAYDRGDRDPRLVAELGLCECDAGNDAAAVPFLEAAVRGRVLRPRAYFELARIRFATLVAQNPAGKLTIPQLKSVITPLLWSRFQAPPLGEAYELMAEAWLRSEATPLGEQLAVLNDSVEQFPQRARLFLLVAHIQVEQHRFDTARALVERGLRVATDPGDRQRLQKLQADLTGP